MKNPVAKHARKFNKGGPMRDRKKAMKRGEVKHKGKQLNSDRQQTDTNNRTNSSAKKPQTYVDKDGKQKTRMVPAHQDVQNEKLNPSQGIKAYIDDFKKSDAPQFKGKSDAKKKEMAIAAYLDAKKGEKKEDCWDGYKRVGMKKKGGKMVPNCVPEETQIDELMYKVNVEGLPTMIVDADSPSQIKSNFRKLFKNPDKVVQDVERVSSAEVQKHFRLKSQGKEEMDEGYNPRAARAQSHAANKMYGRTSDPIDKKPASAAKKPISKADLFRAIDKKYGNPKKKTGIYAPKKEGSDKMNGNKFNPRDMVTFQKMTKEDAEARARLKLKHTKEKENLKNRHSKEREAMKETMDPRDFTDKPGHVVVVKKKDGTRKIKHYHPTSTGAKKYADRVNKVNRVGDKATVHRTDGRKIHEAYDKSHSAHRIARKSATGTPGARAEYHKDGSATVHSGPSGPRTSTDNVNSHLRDVGAEHGHSTKELGNKHVTKHDGHTHTVTAKNGGAGHSIHIKSHGVKEETISEASQKLTNKRAELRKKMFGDANYLSPAQRKELDKAAKAALKKDSASKKAAPPKPVSKTSKGKVRTGSADPADRNIFMQLRKAQDRGGNQAITVSPTGKKVTLNPKQIDMLLKRHDSLQKPVDKRKFKIMLIKSLRAKAK